MQYEKLLNTIVGLFAENAVCNCFLGQIVRTAGGVTGNAGKGRRDSGFVELASLFLKGKILYTPDNNVTRYIVSQVSRATHVFSVHSLMRLDDLIINFGTTTELTQA